MKKLIITGNLGKDPEKRSDGQGKDFATFSVAVSVGTKDKPKTDWVDISCGGKLADVVCAYLKKGSKVLVTGFPTVSAYISKDGGAVGTLRVYADDIEFLTPKDDAVSSSSEVHSLPPTRSDNEADQIPF
jgi:single-strand DNA-binding protein